MHLHNAHTCFNFMRITNHINFDRFKEQRLLGTIDGT